MRLHRTNVKTRIIHSFSTLVSNAATFPSSPEFRTISFFYYTMTSTLLAIPIGFTSLLSQKNSESIDLRLWTTANRVGPMDWELEFAIVRMVSGKEGDKIFFVSQILSSLAITTLFEGLTPCHLSFSSKISKRYTFHTTFLTLIQTYWLHWMKSKGKITTTIIES